MDIITLFCEIDDFFLDYEQYQAQHRLPDILRTGNTKGRPRNLHPSEVMTILVHFHHKRYKNFKTYYQDYVCCHLRRAFPNLVSYSRFVQLSQEVLVPLSIFLYTLFGKCRGVSFIDSTPLPVCHNRRISAHRVFYDNAARSKTSMGWFYGFKLHLVINDHGELLSALVTAGNVDDRIPVPQLCQGLFGKVFADKGYISKDLREKLQEEGVSLIYKVRKNMKPEPISDTDAALLKKRMLIESVYKELKSQTEIQHTRHRSCVNFQVNTIAALIAYTNLKKKPSLKHRELQEEDFQLQKICNF